MTEKKKVYFASPLFSQMEVKYNEYLARELRREIPELDMYVPQEQMEINDKNAYADSQMIAKFDTDALLGSELVIAILDGVSIDVGVASEIGVAYQAGIPIVGLYTDSRQLGATNHKKLDALQEVCENQFHYVNLYTTGLVKLNGKICTSEAELMQEVKNRLS